MFGNLLPKAFADDPEWNIYVSSGNGGSILYEGNPAPALTSVIDQTDAKFTVTPDSKYEVDTITINNTTYNADELSDANGFTKNGDSYDYTFEKVSDNSNSISATYKAITCLITVIVGDNGSVTPDGDAEIGAGLSGVITVNMDDSKSFSVSPESGYQIASIKDEANDDVAFDNNSFSLSDVIKDDTITVLFETIPIHIQNVETTSPAKYGGNDGTITITASGGSGALEYSKDGNTYQDSNVLTGCSAGQYTIDVRDKNVISNIATYDTSIEKTPTLDINATLQSGGTYSDSDKTNGDVTITATGNN